MVGLTILSFDKLPEGLRLSFWRLSVDMCVEDVTCTCPNFTQHLPPCEAQAWIKLPYQKTF